MAKTPSTEASADTVEDMKSLVQSGDINLDDYRSAYKAKYGADTTASDARICECIAYMEHDDPDMDAVIEAMHTNQSFA